LYSQNPGRAEINSQNHPGRMEIDSQNPPGRMKINSQNILAESRLIPKIPLE
jgi:hypothetical protein